MSTVIIPTRTDGTQLYSMTVALGAVNFLLTFSWNARDAAWYLQIADANGSLLLSKKIVADTPVLWRYPDPALPLGELVAIDTSGAGLDPGLTDLGGRVQLTFTDAADLVG